MKTAICAIIKDEHRYLKEWIDYYLGIGFSHIFLFEDYGSKSHEEITKDYSSVSLLSVEKCGIVHNNVRQFKVYSYAIDYLKGLYDWCAFFDIDEFLELDNILLDEFLSQFNEYNGVYVYWEYHDSNNLVEYEDKPVRERFPRITNIIPYTEQPWSFKSIVNLNKDSQLESPHKVIDGVNTKEIKTERCRCYFQAKLAHYYTKSWEEWCWRFTHRGDVSDGHRKLDDFFYANPSMKSQWNELLKFYWKMWHESSREQEWEPIVNVSDNISLVLTAKCGCTTAAWLCTEYNKAKHSRFAHQDANPFKLHERNERMLVSVYRDPVQRFLSFYQDRVVNKHNNNWLNMLGLESAGVDELLNAIEDSFSNDTPFYQDQHIRRQIDTYPIDDIDIIVPIEHLADFLKSQGITPPPPQNVSVGEKPKLTPDQEERIKKLYAADYEILKSPKVWHP